MHRSYYLSLKSDPVFMAIASTSAVVGVLMLGLIVIVGGKRRYELHRFRSARDIPIGTPLRNVDDSYGAMASRCENPSDLGRELRKWVRDVPKIDSHDTTVTLVFLHYDDPCIYILT